jgi:hypothetical protein
MKLGGAQAGVYPAERARGGRGGPKSRPEVDVITSGLEPLSEYNYLPSNCLERKRKIY